MFFLSFSEAEARYSDKVSMDRYQMSDVQQEFAVDIPEH